MYENSIVKLFDNCVNLYPNKIAIKYKNSEYTYFELNNLVNIIFRNIKKYNEKMYAIFSEKTPEMIATILAIWKSGAGYIPIDTELPRERIEYIISNSGVNNIITTKNNSKKVECIINNIYFEDICSDDISNKQNEKTVMDNDIAYIIYTSGSTGKPKGVQITFENLYSFFIAINKKINIKETDTLLSITTISFDISILEMFLPIMIGATLVIGGKRLLVDAKKLKNSIYENNITVLQATPITWEMLVSVGWENNTKIKILCGGEQLNKELAKKLLSLSDCIWNLYGPTEATIWCSVSKITNYNDINIGQPLENAKFYIFDEDMKENTEGELYIGGKCLSKGYINNEPLTNERFITLKNDISEIIYKTGDIVYKRGDMYCYKGRNDFQIKLNGHRIEIEEIEKCMGLNNNVEKAIVVPDHNIKALFGFVILKNKDKNYEDNIKSQLEKLLPGYMIPKRIYEISDVPMTFNKKIDRKALLQNIYNYNDINNRKNITENLLQAWKHVLENDDITLNSNFDSYSIDSLDMINLCLKTNELGIKITLQQLFEYKNIQSIVENLYNIEKKDDISEDIYSSSKILKVIDKYNIKDNIEISELTPFQTAMLQHYLFNRESLAYYESYLYEINTYIEDEKLIGLFKKACSNVDEFKSVYLFNVKGKNIKLKSNDINLIKQEIINCTSLEMYEKEIDSIFFKKYDINDIGIKISIVKYESKKYLGINYHHIRLDGVNYNKLISNFFNSLESEQYIKKNVNTRKLNIFKDFNYVSHFFDKNILQGYCSKNKIKISTVIQYIVMKCYNKHSLKSEECYDIAVANGLNKNNRNDVLIKKISIKNIPLMQYQNVIENAIFNNKYSIQGQSKIIFIINNIPKELYSLYNKYNIIENHIERNNYDINIIVNITNTVNIEIISQRSDIDLNLVMNSIIEEIKKLKGEER